MATLADWLSWELWTQAVHVPLLFWAEAAHAVLSGRAWAGYVANRENILSLATILAGVIGIPLLYIRTRAADQSARAALEQAKVAAAQAKTAADRHNAQTDADRERRITESFAKAAGLLGSEKLATRLGGIYTLERISHESKRMEEYWTVMETLTAYVREHAPWLPRQSDGAADQQQEPELSSKRIRPKTDIQAILRILRRRKKEMRDQEGEDQYIDLSATDLRGAGLGGAYLKRALLSRANLQGAWLVGAHLEDARLAEACLKDVELWNAHLEGADFFKAQLRGADFAGAHLKGNNKCANFEGANLEGAKNLTREH